MGVKFNFYLTHDCKNKLKRSLLLEETPITYVHPYLHTYLLNYLLTYLHTYIPTYLHAYIHTTKFKYILTGTNRTYNHIIHFWRTASTRETEWRLLHSLNFRLISNSDQVEKF